MRTPFFLRLLHELPGYLTESGMIYKGKKGKEDMGSYHRKMVKIYRYRLTQAIRCILDVKDRLFLVRAHTIILEHSIVHTGIFTLDL